MQGQRESADASPTRDDLFETLANRRRRYVIHYLLEHDGPVSLRDLSYQVAAWENGESVAEVSAAERKRVYNALQQAHLPKMHEANVVRYDNGTIEATDALSDLRVYLEVVPGHDIPWSTFYFLLGLLGSALTAAILGGTPPFTAIPTVAYVGVIAGLLTLAGIFHMYEQRSMRLDLGDMPEMDRSGSD